MPTAYLMASVDKALRVLDCFAQPPHIYSVKDLCDLTGYSSNQVFRIVQTLMECGYVRDDLGTGKYRLGWRVFGLTAALVASDALFQAVREPLTEAHRQLGETVSVLVPDGESATIGVGTLHHGSPLLISEIDSRRNGDLHAGAAGHLVLASFEDTRIQRYLDVNMPLREITSATRTTADDVWDLVRTTRQRGYSVSMEEVAVGMYGMAVPVHGRTGDLTAVLTVAAPIGRATPDDQAHHLEVLREAARQMSASLGFEETSSVLRSFSPV